MSHRLTPRSRNPTSEMYPMLKSTLSMAVISRWIRQRMKLRRLSVSSRRRRNEYYDSQSIGRFQVVKEARFHGQETRTIGNSPVGVGEPSVCRHLSQVCWGARFGDPVHADVASGPRIGISAGIPARLRSLRDGGGDSA